MKYEKSAIDRPTVLSAEREWLTPPETDSRLGRLLAEREKHLDKLRCIESELWDEYGLVPD
ncbi:MAG: hypothetical protein IKL92_01035 [Oscillospiraceae bacterium]|nr:hypothetical protein [Oscillospiraceae bacterium]